MAKNAQFNFDCIWLKRAEKNEKNFIKKLRKKEVLIWIFCLVGKIYPRGLISFLADPEVAILEKFKVLSSLSATSNHQLSWPLTQLSFSNSLLQLSISIFCDNFGPSVYLELFFFQAEIGACSPLGRKNRARACESCVNLGHVRLIISHGWFD